MSTLIYSHIHTYTHGLGTGLAVSEHTEALIEVATKVWKNGSNTTTERASEGSECRLGEPGMSG